jgi:hypothetical protein
MARVTEAQWQDIERRRRNGDKIKMIAYVHCVWPSTIKRGLERRRFESEVAARTQAVWNQLMEARLVLHLAESERRNAESRLEECYKLVDQFLDTGNLSLLNVDVLAGRRRRLAAQLRSDHTNQVSETEAAFRKDHLKLLALGDVVAIALRPTVTDAKTMPPAKVLQEIRQCLRACNIETDRTPAPLKLEPVRAASMQRRFGN